jgi:hypothetical protein
MNDKNTNGRKLFFKNDLTMKRCFIIFVLIDIRRGKNLTSSQKLSSPPKGPKNSLSKKESRK